MAVQLQLLGLPRFLVDGRIVAVSLPRRALELLTYLYASRGAQSRDRVAFALWPDADEETARGNLRRNLNELRGVLPAAAAAWIRADAGSLAFDHAVADTDVATFEAGTDAPAELRRAVDIYGGDFAAPLDEPWVLTERERLRARFHAMLTELIGVEFSARRFDAALVYARRIFADEPLREDIARRIIAIRYAMGDRPGALAEYERFAGTLRAELRIDPMPETVGLRDVVLRGEALPFAPDAGGTSPRPALGSPVPPLLPFAGREAPLERVREAWRAASGGAGSALFVGGEAGIGKTRMVAEFLEREVGNGARIFRGTTASPEARPYEALLHALSGAAPYIAALEIEPVWLGVLAPVVPEIGARRVSLPSLAALPPEREVTRLFEACVRLIQALARGRPVVVVLEDLHWSGTGTFEALRYLAARLRGHRVLLIGTHRTGESPRVQTLVRDLCASHHADALMLARFDRAQTLALLANVEPPPAPAVALDLAERSEGHPLFLTELLRENPKSGTAVAGTIGELVAGRLATCSSEAQALARIAACCGATCDLDLLARVAGWDDGTLIDRLAELLDRQFVRVTASHERGSYGFSHALVRSAVIATTAADEQRRIHRIAARALEAREAGSGHEAEIARHWEHAGEAREAAQAYLRAARASFALHARDEAAQHATSGLQLTDDPGLTQALLTTRIEANLRRAPADVLRADARLLTAMAEKLDEAACYEAALLAFAIEEVGGDLESSLAAADVLRQFAADDTATEPRRAQIAEVDAKNALQRANFALALDRADEARRRYAERGQTRDELRVLLLVTKAQARVGRVDDALALLVTAEPRISALDDLALAMEYWNARTSVLGIQRDAAAAFEAAQRLRQIAQAAGDRLMEGHAAMATATAHQQASRLTQALVELDRADAIYRSIGAALFELVTRNNRASLLFQIGRIEASLPLLRGLYDDAKRTDGAAQTLYFAASNLGCALLARGDVAAARSLQREALALARSMGSEGFAALALGDLGAAEIAAGERGAGLEHLLEAAEINRNLNRSAVLAHDLARAAGAEASAERGAAHARSALAVVERDSGQIALAPEILTRCAEALDRAGDVAAAAHCRRRGREVLAARLAGLEGGDRDAYAALPWHRGLVEVEVLR